MRNSVRNPVQISRGELAEPCHRYSWVAFGSAPLVAAVEAAAAVALAADCRTSARRLSPSRSKAQLSRWRIRAVESIRACSCFAAATASACSLAACFSARAVASVRSLPVALMTPSVAREPTAAPLTNPPTRSRVSRFFSNAAIDFSLMLSFSLRRSSGGSLDASISMETKPLHRSGSQSHDKRAAKIPSPISQIVRLAGGSHRGRIGVAWGSHGGPCRDAAVSVFRSGSRTYLATAKMFRKTSESLNFSPHPSRFAAFS